MDKELSYKVTALEEKTYELLVKFFRRDGVDWISLSAFKRQENGGTYEITNFKIPAELLRQLAKDLRVQG